LIRVLLDWSATGLVVHDDNVNMLIEGFVGLKVDKYYSLW